MPSLRSRSRSSAWSGALSRKTVSRSQSFWKAWLKKRSFWRSSKMATAVLSWSSVSAWLRSVRSYSAETFSISVTSLARPAEPDGPATSVTAKTLRSPPTTVETRAKDRLGQVMRGDGLPAAVPRNCRSLSTAVSAVSVSTAAA
jgi:hypothetical protein